ncbi:MAG TPA: hypothetical protein VFZ65_10685 [Planctomycetota bacterium]|nr:hypothetical protein [Planctomycetota bacterium]
MPTDVAAHLSEVVFAADAATLRAVLRVPAAHATLAGHFPGAPLVPGVLLVDAVRGACERALAQSLSIVEVEDVRFFRPVAPDEAIVLSARLQRTDGGCSVDAEWQGTSGRCATVRVRLVEVAATHGGLHP